MKKLLGCTRVSTARRREHDVFLTGKRGAIKGCQPRGGRLTDGFIEGLIDRSFFEEHKNAILLNRKNSDERKALLMQSDRSAAERLNYILELCGIPYVLYNSGFFLKNRDVFVVSPRGKLYLLGAPVYDEWVVSKAPRIRAYCGNVTHLSRDAFADYGIRHGTHRRGTPRIPGNLETNVQRGPTARRRTALRLAAHRALYPACETSAVGEEALYAA